MATLTPTFRADAARIHDEHRALERALDRAEPALERLVCYGEVFADLSVGDELRRFGKELAEHFPEHCRREEAVLLDRVAEVSPELAEFSRQMKVEHVGLLARLDDFCGALDEFNRMDDASEAVYHLKEKGTELTREMRRHLATEEQELDGFL
jgi:hemerythrin-like domain-containing protein